MEVRRKRGTAITRFLLFPWFLFLVMSIALILLRGNVALGLVYGLLSLQSIIGAFAISQGVTSNANTQRILRAIESLRQQKPNS
jgi:hypothetical protein